LDVLPHQLERLARLPLARAHHRPPEQRVPPQLPERVAAQRESFSMIYWNHEHAVAVRFEELEDQHLQRDHLDGEPCLLVAHDELEELRDVLARLVRLEQHLVDALDLGDVRRCAHEAAAAIAAYPARMTARNELSSIVGSTVKFRLSGEFEIPRRTRTCTSASPRGAQRVGPGVSSAVTRHAGREGAGLLCTVPCPTPGELGAAMPRVLSS